ncbi:MAG: hypothetical protein ACXVA9_05530 [Bdellovibrionales bacterium]
MVKTEPYTSERCPNAEFAKRTRMTNYYTPVMAPIKCKNGQLGLLNFSEKEKNGNACNQKTIDAVVKRMEGAGTVLSELGQFQGVLVSPRGPILEISNSGMYFSETLPKGSPDGMFHVAPPQCPLGYGSKLNGDPVCLDPFRTIACSPRHAIGDLAFIPAAVGITYPRFPGQPKEDYDRLPGHDGYFICGDIGDMIQGEHVDLFTAFINPYAAKNPFGIFSSTRKYGVCWVPNEDKDRERRYQFHKASDVNPQFPYLDEWTLANYANNRLLAQAFGLPWSIVVSADDSN